MTTGSYDSLKKTSNINTCMTFFKVQFFIIQSLLNLRSCLGNFLSRDQKRTTRNKFGNKNRKEASSIILFFRNGRPEIKKRKQIMAPRYYHVLPFLTISVKYIQPSLRNSVDKKGKKKEKILQLLYRGNATESKEIKHRS